MSLSEYLLACFLAIVLGYVVLEVGIITPARDILEDTAAKLSRR